MRSTLRISVLSMFVAPIRLAAQTQNQSLSIPGADGPELQLFLVPGQVIRGVPVDFLFRLVNAGKRDLRLPEPYLDCGNSTLNGSVLLNESWQPSEGSGLDKLPTICDFVGSTLPSPPVTELVKNWHLLKPGESLYIRADQAALHFKSSAAGVYTFSAIYFPPSLSKLQVQDLENAGIEMPHRKTISATLRYESGDRI